MSYSAFIPALLALLLSAAFTGFSIPLARLAGAVDKPGGIKIHNRPMPHLGGLGIVVGFGVCGYLFGVLGAWGILGLLVIASIGAVDDRFGLSATYKLTGQAVAGILLGMHFYTLSGDLTQALLAFVLVVGLTNSVNLIDGMDGLAAGSTMISAIGLAFLVGLLGLNLVLPVILAASIMGLLFWNYPKARTFMGDMGSLAIGYALACIIAYTFSFGFTAFLGASLMVAVPVANTALAIVRRWLNRRPLFRGDREHFFDKLFRSVGCPIKTIWIVYGISAGFVIMGMFEALLKPQYGLFLLGSLAVVGVYFAARLGWLAHEPDTTDHTLLALEVAEEDDFPSDVKEEIRRKESSTEPGVPGLLGHDALRRRKSGRLAEPVEVEAD